MPTDMKSQVGMSDLISSDAAAQVSAASLCRVAGLASSAAARSAFALASTVSAVAGGGAR